MWWRWHGGCGCECEYGWEYGCSTTAAAVAAAAVRSAICLCYFVSNKSTDGHVGGRGGPTFGSSGFYAVASYDVPSHTSRGMDRMEAAPVPMPVC